MSLDRAIVLVVAVLITAWLALKEAAPSLLAAALVLAVAKVAGIV